ncbi:MAG TPA: aminotransferase class V-fold PLP-dependent enzyme [Anaerolineales bacterium]|jgi:selenocysteine lyase/cysteine desulfurase
MDPAYDDFLKKFPEYENTLQIDALRARDYQRLDRDEHIYLDYTGSGIYAESQVLKHQKILLENTFGNPHSSNPTSQAATRYVESAREFVLDYFKADSVEYDVIFTTNASGALKIVGESYPFSGGDQFLLTFDNHNSVNGIREFAHGKGAQVTYIPLSLPDMRVDDTILEDALNKASTGGNNLFAYPAQSNFSSVKHPLEWIARAKAKGWDVLLDAAAFAPTNPLDLSRWKPDFVPLSFYKIFGYPTGLGALLVRRQVLRKLQRPWFAGGTITVASVQGDKYYLAEGHSAFEDGTIDFLNIPAVEIGLRHIQAIGIDNIQRRVRCLTGWLLENLTSMRHHSGTPLVRLYGPLSSEARGGAVTVNFYKASGEAIDHRSIEEAASKVNISLRTGCFCNPGAGELALGISRVELDVCFNGPGHEQRLSVDDFRVCIDGKSSGAVRISIGMVTNFKDVQGFLHFAQSLLEV